MCWCRPPPHTAPPLPYSTHTTSGPHAPGVHPPLLCPTLLFYTHGPSTSGLRQSRTTPIPLHCTTDQWSLNPVLHPHWPLHSSATIMILTSLLYTQQHWPLHPPSLNYALSVHPPTMASTPTIYISYTHALYPSTLIPTPLLCFHHQWSLHPSVPSWSDVYPCSTHASGGLLHLSYTSAQHPPTSSSYHHTSRLSP